MSRILDYSGTASIYDCQATGTPGHSDGRKTLRPLWKLVCRWDYSETDARTCFRGITLTNPIKTEPSLKRDAALIALVAAPFFLNDFIFLNIETAHQWLAADYGSKLFALAVLFAVVPLRRAAVSTIKLKSPIKEAVILAVLCAGAVIFADYFFRVLLPIEIESLVLFRYPPLPPGVLYWTDITFGLALTSVSEEFIFRGVFAVLAARYLPGTTAMVLVSAVVFALIHWSHGLASVVIAGIAGVALMALYLRTGSVLPGIAAHYAINFSDFI
jgi:membrane protease YdiL (CAAX protease family)